MGKIDILWGLLLWLSEKVLVMGRTCCVFGCNVCSHDRRGKKLDSGLSFYCFPDKHITENCGLLNKLLPGDLVLADRGFDIKDSVGMMCAEVKIPAFIKSRCQLDAKNVEDTRAIAHLRIHVERVLGSLRNKYTLLHNTIPICLLLPCKDEELTLLDKIVNVCCFLVNVSKCCC